MKLVKNDIMRVYKSIIIVLILLWGNPFVLLFSQNSSLLVPVKYTIELDTINTSHKILQRENILLNDYLVSLSVNSDKNFTIHNINTCSYIGNIGDISEFDKKSRIRGLEPAKDGFYAYDKKYLYHIQFEVSEENRIEYVISKVYTFPIKKHNSVNWASGLSSDSLFIYALNDDVENSIYWGVPNDKCIKSSFSNYLDTPYSINNIKLKRRCKPDQSAIVMLPDYNCKNLIIIKTSGELVVNKKLNYLVTHKEGWLTHYYTSIYTTDQFIYGLFSNLTYKLGSDSILPNNQCEIHIWDWEGNMVKRLIINMDLDNIYADSNNKIIYGLVNNGVKCYVYRIES